MDHMSRSNYFIAFACSEGTLGLPACPKAGFGAAGPKPGRSPVAWFDSSLRRGEAWKEGSAEGWGGVCRSRVASGITVARASRLLAAAAVLASYNSNWWLKHRLHAATQ